jgi:hypothetical protein
VRALYYWIREKARGGWRLLRRGDADLARRWRALSRPARTRILAVAGVVVLYAVIKFAPVPGVPCQVSAAKECAPPNDTIAFVPADAALYAHLTIDRDSHQYELVRDFFDQIPDIRQQLIGTGLPSPAGAPVNLADQVAPWAEQDLALTLVPGPAKSTLPVYVVGVGDREEADRFLAGIAPPGEPTSSEQDGASVSVYGGGFATAYSGDQLLFGNESAVRAALQSEAGKVERLEDSDQDAVRAELPEVRFAEIYLSRAGVQRLLVGRRGPATQLATFVDYGATNAVAASATARDDGLEVNLVSRLDPNLLKQSPTFFGELPKFEPDLADEAGDRALGYIGLGDVGPTLAKVLESAGPNAQGLAGSLRAQAQRLQEEAGVDPVKDLLPALGGQAALIAEPTDGVPIASLIVEGVDEDKVNQALAGLQGPLLRSLGTRGGTTSPKVEQSEEDGVTVSSVQVSPTVNLSYAVFDGKLVISTEPAGIAQVSSDEDGLAGSDAFERATDDLPGKVSALVFLNLDELFGQVGRTDLIEDPLFASLSVYLDNLRSAAIAVTSGDDQLKSELFIASD